MISVIIPVLDEERALPATLAALFRQTGEFEVIAVDGGSRDRSVWLLAADKRIRLIAAPRGRAAQMNAGAALAGGEILLFLHADTLLPDGAIAALAGLTTGSVWGGFRHRFNRRDWRLALISGLHNLRCRLTQVFYGDQAMFVSRKLFHEVGGFPEGLMEDIAISERLLSKLMPIFLVNCVTTDARKFLREGVWLSLWRVLAILVCRARGWPIPMAFFRDLR